MFMPYFFHPLDFLIIIAFLVSLWAQFKVKGNYQKYLEVRATTNMTGAQVARYLLDRRGLYDVGVEPVHGLLSDHYDPIAKKVRLSEGIYHGSSISSIAIAAHEVGHAYQHADHYSMLVLRHRMFPVVNISSGIAPYLILSGFLFNATNLIGLGIIFFSAVVAFQLVTLPVEFNASSRAKRLLLSEGFIDRTEEKGINKVLGAAALTYVAAALISFLQLLKYILIFAGRNNDE